MAEWRHAGGKRARARHHPLEDWVQLVPHSVSERLPDCVYERALDIVRKVTETEPSRNEPDGSVVNGTMGKKLGWGEPDWRNIQDRGGAVLLLKSGLFGTVLSPTLWCSPWSATDRMP